MNHGLNIFKKKGVRKVSSYTEHKRLLLHSKTHTYLKMSFNFPGKVSVRVPPGNCVAHIISFPDTDASCHVNN